MAHKFKIVKRKSGQFAVRFVYNAEIIYWSENYVAKSSATNCIKSLVKHAPGAPEIDMTKGETGTGYRFEIVAARDGQPFVRFVASNGETMARTETYSSKANARHAIESLKKNGPAAMVEDATA